MVSLLYFIGNDEEEETMMPFPKARKSTEAALLFDENNEPFIKDLVESNITFKVVLKNDTVFPKGTCVKIYAKNCCCFNFYYSMR